MRVFGDLRILTGTSHPELCQSVANILNCPVTNAIVANFANGETRVEIKESCRGDDCFVIQPICNNENNTKGVNDALMELLIMISALRGSSAERITAVIPIYGYARQDKKDKSRAAISARLVADLLQAAGVHRVMTVDLHSSQIQGFFTIPVDNLYGEDFLIKHMKTNIQYKLNSSSEIVVVAPDAGGAKRALRVANKLGDDVSCAIISKERLQANEVASMRLVGNVEGKIAIIVDDMADTCGTLCKAAETLKENGAAQVHAYVVHGVLSGPAIKRLNNCDDITSVVVTNTIPQKGNQRDCKKLDVVDVSDILAEAISCTHSSSSISALFQTPYVSPSHVTNKKKTTE